MISTDKTNPSNNISKIQIELESTNNQSFKVPQKLLNPDKLILKAKDSLENKKLKYTNYIGSVNTACGELDIRVTPKNIGRALRFMDAFIKLLKARNHNIKIRNYDTYVLVNEVEFKVSFKEKLKRVIIKGGSWDRTELHPTNILYFKIDHFWAGDNSHEIEFKDGKILVEEQLSKIIATLEYYSLIMKADRVEREIINKKREEEEKIKREIQERKEKDLNDFKELIISANRWKQSVILSEYLEQIESNAITNNTLSDELKNWLTWARNKAHEFNPLNNIIK